VHSKEPNIATSAILTAPPLAALRRVARILAFTLFTAVGAQLAIRLPFTPVPLTMQTVFVVLAGMTLGARDGFYAMVSYLAAGLAGAPVFAGFGFGPAALIGPTGGYLVAFPAAALVAGFAVEKLRGRFAPLVASTVGLTLILLAGAAYLALLSGASIGTVAAMAVLPFVPGELIKAVAAAGLTGARSRS